MKKILFFIPIIIVLTGCSNSPKAEASTKDDEHFTEEKAINSNETIEGELPNVFKKGDIVKLFKEEEWSVEQQQFVKAAKASIFSDKRSLTDEHLVATYPNGTQAEIIDLYEENLKDGSIWRVYKVKTKTSPSKEGWIADFDVSQ